MAARLIDGKILASSIRKEIAAKIAAHKQQRLREPSLAVILVGDDAASALYVRHKREACHEVGMQSIYHPLPAKVSEEALINLIHQLNEDSSIDGILLQLPLPEHIDVGKVLELIDPHKDVDGFHPYNLCRLVQP